MAHSAALMSPATVRKLCGAIAKRIQHLEKTFVLYRIGDGQLPELQKALPHMQDPDRIALVICLVRKAEKIYLRRPDSSPHWRDVLMVAFSILNRLDWSDSVYIAIADVLGTFYHATESDSSGEKFFRKNSALALLALAHQFALARYELWRLLQKKHVSKKKKRRDKKRKFR